LAATIPPLGGPRAEDGAGKKAGHYCRVDRQERPFASLGDSWHECQRYME